jgi:hypothetical protein
MIQYIGNSTVAARDLGLRPDTALAFWLGGLRDASGNFVGFSADPTDPFNLRDGHAYNAQASSPEGRIGPYFDFDKTRVNQTVYTSGTPPTETLNANGSSVTNTDSANSNASCTYYLGGAAYFAQNDLAIDMTQFSPYLYFKAVQNKYSDMVSTPAISPKNATEYYHWWYQTADSGVYVTAFKDARYPTALYTSGTIPVTRACVNPQSFQLLCPGLDGLFGAPTGGNFISMTTAEDKDSGGHYAPLYPDGVNYNPLRTYDDVTNFGSGSLKNDMP